jgi:pyridoxal phosphate enzyme (YggS family)
MTQEDRYQQIFNRIESACARVQRESSSVKLIAVSKTHPPESVKAMSQMGVRDFGENKVQEAKAKIPECPSNLNWHGIGHLQTNKAKDAVRLFSMIHSVDSLKLAQELAKQAENQSKHLPILLEVNVSGEGTKFGLKPSEVFEVASSINSFSHLEFQGLMTMAPFSENSETARPFFRKLAELKKDLEHKFGASIPHLSMGMSGDFEIAIEEGSTMVRIGTALFGERKSSAFRRSIGSDD